MTSPGPGPARSPSPIDLERCGARNYDPLKVVLERGGTSGWTHRPSPLGMMSAYPR